ncbi:hypothetical protein, partial [Fictibacillus sp. NRS-1165]|uniref:hypothetical protein n=1 Tax=Fictibacillus sp. NRS-1165 TaxID=3144463 RepID=UPI003D1AFAFD
GFQRTVYPVAFKQRQEISYQISLAKSTTFFTRFFEGNDVSKAATFITIPTIHKVVNLFLNKKANLFKMAAHLQTHYRISHMPVDAGMRAGIRNQALIHQAPTALSS